MSDVADGLQHVPADARRMTAPGSTIAPRERARRQHAEREREQADVEQVASTKSADAHPRRTVRARRSR